MKEAWQKRNHSNLHFIYFEDLKRKPHETINGIAEFLEKPLTSRQLLNVCSSLNLSSSSCETACYFLLYLVQQTQ